MMNDIKIMIGSIFNSKKELTYEVICRPKTGRTINQNGDPVQDFEIDDNGRIFNLRDSLIKDRSQD